MPLLLYSVISTRFFLQSNTCLSWTFFGLGLLVPNPAVVSFCQYSTLTSKTHAVSRRNGIPASLEPGLSFCALRRFGGSTPPDGPDGPDEQDETPFTNYGCEVRPPESFFQLEKRPDLPLYKYPFCARHRSWASARRGRERELEREERTGLGDSDRTNCYCHRSPIDHCCRGDPEPPIPWPIASKTTARGRARPTQSCCTARNTALVRPLPAPSPLTTS